MIPENPGEAAERVVLVDAADRPVGTAPKLEAHRLGLRHRAFSVLVTDRQGRWLLQRRASAKYHSGGLWSNSCCGHPRPEEATASAAARRLHEELGIRCQMTPLGTVSYAVAFDNGLSENEVVTLYGARHDGPLAPDPAEVEATAWLNLPDLLADAGARPEAFTYWFRLYLTEHLPMLRRAG